MSVWRNMTCLALRLFVTQTINDNTHVSVSVSDTVSNSASSTAYLDQPVAFQINLQATLSGYSASFSIRHLTATKLATPHNPSPFAGGSIWDPSDEEWAEVDAYRITNTFNASFKNPGQQNGVSSSQKDGSALSRLTSTITSLIPLPPTNRPNQEETDLDEKLSMLKNTYFTSPNGDLSDSIMLTCFLPRSSIFPSSTTSSPRTMHVIDLARYFTTQDPLLQAAHPRLCDATATILSHTNTACITAFLNPSVQEFTYKREVEGRKGGTTLLIRRHQNSVIAGCYRNHGFSLQWSLYVRSRFNALGQWYDEYGAPACGATPVVAAGEVMWHVFTPDGVRSGDDDEEQQQRQGSSVDAALRGVVGFGLEDGDGDEGDDGGREAKFALYQSRVLARYLMWDVWVRLDGRYECRAVWEADGEVNTVRLKRGLVGFDDEDEE
ncbi:hypothetical protein J3E73DRAFT_424846 [Bipolaris maydis]|nr:hypothetical protein J3E73DRAFT_424846 [Bipolaris maydis]